ncbi:MAG TPA: selenide, water dikinase SelD, partial [Gemmataceae bacterium]|nr:selenide, water dikinase SelD [Gemmataceae bacterium]
APGGTHANWKFLADWVTFAAGLTKEDQLLLCDAQTSGGLLASVAVADVAKVVGALQKSGTLAAAVIGRIDAASPGRISALMAKPAH